MKSRLQKLYENLARISRYRLKGLASADVLIECLQDIVSRQQFEIRELKDTINLKDRQLRREKRRTKVYKEIADSHMEKQI